MRSRASAYVLISTLLWASPGLTQQDTVTTQERTFTTDADFALGTFEWTRAGAPAADQLRIDTGASVPPFLWITHATQGLVTKVDTRTGTQVARYDSVLTRNWDGTIPDVKPPRDACNHPVPTAVDARGNAFVVNRGNCSGTYAAITKYASSGAECVDRNGNGVIDTSQDANQDGTIDPANPAEFLGQEDECILWTKNYAAMSDPGRSLVVDADQNVWAAGYVSSKIYKLDGKSGEVLKVIDLKAETGVTSNIQSLAIGPGGYLYTSDISTQRRIRKLNPKASAGNHVVDTLTSPVPTFGIAVDTRGVVWLGGDSDSASGVVQVDFGARTARVVGGGGGCLGRTHGIAVDAAGDIWASCWSTNRLLRVSPSGTFKQSWVVGSRPEGVAVAASGKIWTVNTNTNTLSAVDPAVPSSSQTFSVGGAPLTYADMTGFQHHAFILRQGSWRVVYDSRRAHAHWGTITWNTEPEGTIPAGSSITVEARAAATPGALAVQNFVPVLNGQPFAGVDGRFIELKVMLRAVNFSGDPVLSDLTISSYNNRPVALCRNQNVCASQTCTAEVSVDNGSYDPDGDPFTRAQSPAGPYGLGSRTVSFTVDDESLNSSCSASVRVRDCEPPSITCAPVATECTGSESATLAAQGADATDACSPVSVSGPEPAAYPLGSTAVTYTAMDAEGNTATCTSNVRVVDSQPPTIVCPAPTTAECVDGGASSSGVGQASASDVCSSVSLLSPAPASFPLGTAQLTWSATDTSGNAAACSTSFTVADTQVPTVALDGSGAQTVECGTNYVDLGATASDLCAGDLSGQVVAHGTVLTGQPGGYTLTYRVVDPSGNASVPASRKVTVADTQPPSVALNGPATVVHECATSFLDPGATATDVCAGDVSTWVTLAGLVDPGQPGSYVLTYSATDPSGNTAAPVSRTVQVQDTQAPSLVLHGANPLPLECMRDAYIEPGATALDTCAGDLSSALQIEHLPIDSAVPGTYAVTYRATDTAGNSTTATREVNVRDSLPPELHLNGLANLTLECNVASYSEPGASAIDLCSGDLSGSITVTGAVNTATPGTYPVHYRVQDGRGHEVEQTRNVQVVDTLPPTLTVQDQPAPMVECSRDAFLSQGAIAMDVCAGDISSRIVVSGLENIVTPGTYPVTYSVTDPSGNAATSVTRSLMVQDTQAPVVTLNGAANMELECGVASYTEPGATAYDACQGDMTSQLHRYGSGANAQAEGTYFIQYGVWDASGNTTMALRTVKVSDRIPPVLSLVGLSTLQHECASAPYFDLGATATDACYGNLTHSVTTTGSVNAWTPGNYLLTYNVQDSAHLSATPLTRTVQVGDTQAPVFELRQVSLWPPDESLHDFTLADCMNLQDACDGWMSGTQGKVLSIYSDEPEDAPGNSDGSTQGDILITGSSSFRLRTERQSDGDGRVYGVNFEVKDRAGNLRQGMCRIVVPPTAGGIAADSGPETGYTVSNPQLSPLARAGK